MGSRLAAAALLLIPSLALTGCGGTQTVNLSGEIKTTSVYADVLPLSGPRDCSQHQVEVADGAGKVIFVGKSSVKAKDLTETSVGVHQLICTSSYSFDVPLADVYQVSVPNVSGILGPTPERKFNRTGDQIKVELMSWMYRVP